MFEIVVEKPFSAAHHLPAFDGLDGRPHGHNFLVKVWVRGETLDEANVFYDYKVLKADLKKILADLDYTDLNLLALLNEANPSAEKVARYIFYRMRQSIPELSKVCVYETSRYCACYCE